MKTIDIFGYSFSAIKLRKLRAGLTILGVVIGIAAIVALLSITQGLQTTITHSLNQGLSTDSLIVTAGSSSGSGLGAGGGIGGGLSGGGSQNSGFALHVNDTTAIDGLSPDIVSSFAIISRSGYVQTSDSNRTVTIYGVDYNSYATVYSTTFTGWQRNHPYKPAKQRRSCRLQCCQRRYRQKRQKHIHAF